MIITERRTDLKGKKMKREGMMNARKKKRRRKAQTETKASPTRAIQTDTQTSWSRRDSKGTKGKVRVHSRRLIRRGKMRRVEKDKIWVKRISLSSHRINLGLIRQIMRVKTIEIKDKEGNRVSKTSQR